MHWTKRAIEELDRQRVKHSLISDMPLVYFTEREVTEEEGREVHATDVAAAGDKYGPHITTMGYGSRPPLGSESLGRAEG